MDFIGLQSVINNGLIIQYGNYNTATNNVWITTTLPKAFTVTHYSVCLIQRNDISTQSYPAICVPGVKNRTKTTMDIGFRWTTDSSKSYICWFAIGY